MNCQCITRIEKNLSEHYTTQIGTGVRATATLEVAYGMSDSGIDEMFFINAKVTADAKGFQKGKKQKMFVTYCPFCGTKQRE